MMLPEKMEEPPIHGTKVGYGMFLTVGLSFGLFLAGQIFILVEYAVHTDRIAQTEIARNDEFVKRLDEFASRLNAMDRDGTRKSALIEERQNTVIRRLDAIETHIGVPTP